MAVPAWTAERRQWLKLAVPVNLRRAHHRGMPVANVVSMIFMDRRGPDFDDPDRLGRGIQREMFEIKRNRTDLTFVLALRLMRLMPGALSLIADRHKCRATALLTNLGRVLKHCRLPRQEARLVAGNVVLQRMQLLAPTRPYQCVAFAASRYAGRLSIDLAYDERVLRREQAQELLEIYAAQVRGSMA